MGLRVWGWGLAGGGLRVCGFRVQSGLGFTVLGGLGFRVGVVGAFLGATG